MNLDFLSSWLATQKLPLSNALLRAVLSGDKVWCSLLESGFGRLVLHRETESVPVPWFRLVSLFVLSTSVPVGDR